MSRDLDEVEAGERVAVHYTSNFNDDTEKTIVGVTDAVDSDIGRVFFVDDVYDQGWEFDSHGQLIRAEDDLKMGVDGTLYVLEEVEVDGRDPTAESDTE